MAKGKNVVRTNLQRGRATGKPVGTTRGQTAPKPGKARVGETGTAKAVVMPNRGGSSRPTGRSWSS